LFSFFEIGFEDNKCNITQPLNYKYNNKRINNMTDKDKHGSAGSEASCNCDYSLAFLLLRGWLGLRALMSGVEKFGAYKTIQQPMIDPTTGQPDATGAVMDVKVKFYEFANYSGIPASMKTKFAAESLLPGFSLNLFDKLLGPALILTGLMLLIGLGTRTSLFVQGLIYIALSVGLILINQPDGIAWLGIHMALIAFALVLAKYNKLTLLKKW
jgi:thiosulfate dehydrogenase (quinone) large subunit